MIVERLAGKRFGAYIDERLIQPANLQATRMNIARADVKNRASGYNWTDGAFLYA
jgi:CubicO group peptidase (beta-lactamase class C family)